MGWGSPDSSQHGWAQEWEPVAIKVVPNTDHAQREVAALERVQQAWEQLPGSRHVIKLLEAHSHTKQSTGAQMHIVTRYTAVIKSRTADSMLICMLQPACV